MAYRSPESLGSYSRYLALFVRAAGQRPSSRFLDYGASSRIYANWLAQHGECSVYRPVLNPTHGVKDRYVINGVARLGNRSFHGIHLKEGLEKTTDLTAVFSHVALLLVEGGVVMTTFRDFSTEEANHRKSLGLPSLDPESITNTCHLNGISISLEGRWVHADHFEGNNPHPMTYHVLLGTLTVPA